MRCIKMEVTSPHHGILPVVKILPLQCIHGLLAVKRPHTLSCINESMLVHEKADSLGSGLQRIQGFPDTEHSQPILQ